METKEASINGASFYQPQGPTEECNYDSVPRITPFVANSILIRGVTHTFIKSFHNKRK